MSAHKPSFAFLLILALTATPGPMWAQDIFVRPNSGGGTNAPTIDYGMKAKPAQPPAQQPTPQAKPYTPPPAAAPARPSTPPPVAVYAPQPSSPSPNNVAAQSIGKDVTVFKLPEDEPPKQGEGPDSLTVNFQPGLIGTKDKNLVIQSLGLNEKEVQDNCFFRHSALLSYGNSDAALLPAGSAQSLRYQFTGPLQLVDVYPSVVCRKIRPPVSGMVMEQGSYYVTSLDVVTCPLGSKTKGTMNLTFRYTGDSTGQCVYQ